MALKLKTTTGDVYFNPHLIARVHLSPDHDMITVHFVNGTQFTSPAETAQDRTRVAEFLVRLTEKNRGFLACGKELLNLKSALLVIVPENGPIQVRSEDNRMHALYDADPERVRRTLSDPEAEPGP
jgi:hypothetical protein